MHIILELYEFLLSSLIMIRQTNEQSNLHFVLLFCRFVALFQLEFTTVINNY